MEVSNMVKREIFLLKKGSGKYLQPTRILSIKTKKVCFKIRKDQQIVVSYFKFQHLIFNSSFSTNFKEILFIRNCKLFIEKFKKKCNKLFFKHVLS